MKNIRIAICCLFIGLLFFVPLDLNAQKKSIQEVKELLLAQQKDWNNGDIPAFMEGYWKSDQLQFIGSKGITYGWESTLNNYIKGYPNKEAMGQLAFELLGVDLQSRKVVSVTGKFILTRSNGEVLDGHFLLIVKKIKGEWRIIADHTS